MRKPLSTPFIQMEPIDPDMPGFHFLKEREYLNYE